MSADDQHPTTTPATKPGPICPTCGSTQTLRIAYGLPRREMRERAARGEFILGGCVFSAAASPRWFCTACHARFRRGARQRRPATEAHAARV